MTQKLADIAPSIAAAVKGYVERRLAEIVDSVEAMRSELKAIPHGPKGDKGEQGIKGEKGADGVGLAGAMIDRDGCLLVTMTNGEVKSLGQVVGRDGFSLDSFDMEYIPDSHEICVKATCGARTKEIRYPAGGIRPAGYWREGTKAKAAEAWVHDGSTWFAKKDTSAKPESTSSDWVIAARKGRDGERGLKGVDASPPAPIKLKA